MRFLLVALCVISLPLAALRAEDSTDDNKGPVPEEIPDFSRLDEYVYVPKATLSMGSRIFINGPKATYSGQGSIPSDVGPLANPNIPNVSRTYADGDVEPDARSIPVNSGVGQSYTYPVASDGRTNTWTYSNANQLLPDGNIAFHTYAGEVTDTGVHDASSESSVGIELILDRDMGKLGKHFKWSITAGFSLADIHSSTYQAVATNMTTVTDTYDLFGQVPPAPPYTSPNSISQTVLNSSGGATSGSTSNTTQEATQTILLGNKPLGETTDTTQVLSTNRYFIEGAYYTLRVGPTIVLPMGQHFKLTASAGPDLIYSGSEYNVLEDLVYATGEPALTQLYQKENTKLMPGYYVDVNLRYDMTDTAGFYVGGVYEGSGSYSQSVSSGTSTAYNTKIDFQSEEGVKGGLTLRF